MSDMRKIDLKKRPTAIHEVKMSKEDFEYYMNDPHVILIETNGVSVTKNV